jgi:uncharacterized protein YcbX
MSQATVTQLFIHPIKGLTPQAGDRALLLPGHGIKGDRAMALMFVDTSDKMPVESPENVPWQSKKYFAVQNDWPGLARLKFIYHPENAELRVSIGQSASPLLVAATNTSQGRAAISAFFTSYLAGLKPTEKARHPQYSPVQLVGTSTGETRYSDRQSGHISIISQATVDEISRYMGAEVDIRRFRPNIVVDGVAPWSEFDWVGKELYLGESRILVSARIGRCVNIEVNPETGDRDLPLCRLLTEQFGHLQTGVVGEVISGGYIQIGDRLEIV